MLSSRPTPFGALGRSLALLCVLLVACGGSASSGNSSDTDLADAAVDAPEDARQMEAGDASDDIGPRDAALDSASPDVELDSAAPDVPEDTEEVEDTAPDVPEDTSEDTSDVEEDTPPTTVDVRIMAANTTSGNLQSYDEGHGTRIFQGLVPDITLIQEFSYGDNSEHDIRAFVDLAFGESFTYYREPDSNLPNGVVSRWPILEAGVWEDDEAPNREFVWARIDIPGPIDLWAVSVHLLTRSAVVRNTEAEQLVGYIQAQVPADDYLVVGGDLNTDDGQEDALVTLDAVVSFRHTPVDCNGNPNTNQSRARPYDWVIPDNDLNLHHAPLVIGDQSFPDGLVFDSRVFTPLELVAPVLFEDSDAPQMQHMAVIKRFVVPADEP